MNKRTAFLVASLSIAPAVAYSQTSQPPMTLQALKNVFAATEWANLATLQCGERSMRWFNQIQRGVSIAMSQGAGMTPEAQAWYDAHYTGGETLPVGATCADIETSPIIQGLDQMVLRANNQ